MKFQNPSFKFFLNGRTHGRMHGQAESNMLPTFSKLGVSCQLVQYMQTTHIIIYSFC